MQNPPAKNENESKLLGKYSSLLQAKMGPLHDEFNRLLGDSVPNDISKEELGNLLRVSLAPYLDFPPNGVARDGQPNESTITEVTVEEADMNPTGGPSNDEPTDQKFECQNCGDDFPDEQERDDHWKKMHGTSNGL